MAERRMFAKSIVFSDAFLDMPMSARCLYFTLGMFADDDGFVNSPKALMRQCGASMDDLNILVAKKFVIFFASGIIVIKHWRIHNYIRQDTYNPTKYVEEKEQLELDENKAYTLCPSTGRPREVDESETQDRLGKDRLGKDNIINVPSSTFVPEGDVSKKPRFTKPTVDDIRAYCLERKNNVDPQNFYDFYESKGWMVGKTHMKDWKASVRTWEKSSTNNKPVSKVSLIADGSDTSKYTKTEWD